MLLQCLVAAEISWAVSLWALKMSLLFLYVRLFTFRTFRLAAYTLMVIVTLYFIGCLLFFTLDCKPLTGSHCTNQNAGQSYSTNDAERPFIDLEQDGPVLVP